MKASKRMYTVNKTYITMVIHLWLQNRLDIKNCKKLINVDVYNTAMYMY